MPLSAGSTPKIRRTVSCRPRVVFASYVNLAGLDGALTAALPCIRKSLPYYDPMLAKLVALRRHAGGSPAGACKPCCAITRSSESPRIGSFYWTILTSAAFATGATDTDFLNRHFSDWQPGTTMSEQLIAIAALGDMLQRHGQGMASPATPALADSRLGHAMATLLIIGAWEARGEVFLSTAAHRHDHGGRGDHSCA